MTRFLIVLAALVASVLSLPIPDSSEVHADGYGIVRSVATVRGFGGIAAVPSTTDTRAVADAPSTDDYGIVRSVAAVRGFRTVAAVPDVETDGFEIV
ncbi:hypothetical protein B0H16DRAFT_1717429 [Mycena metata]|uniref:Uncharacterized protein n=1 Tax=Mycena metata TaxID=1033252 RepID=A0AAD7JJN1_9AGAR|nr:hypothetical protein B0H16DRAFT_1717429 [Mycena metata]